MDQLPEIYRIVILIYSYQVTLSHGISPSQLAIEKHVLVWFEILNDNLFQRGCPRPWEKGLKNYPFGL